MFLARTASFRVWGADGAASRRSMPPGFCPARRR